MSDRKIVAIALIGALFLVVVVTVISNIAVGTASADGIALVKDDWGYTVHDAQTGQFLANVSTEKDPFVKVFYFGDKPENGDHIKVSVLYVQELFNMDLRYLTVVSAKKLPAIQHVQPKPFAELFVLVNDCNGCDVTIISIDCRGWGIQQLGIPSSHLVRLVNTDGRWRYPVELIGYGYFSYYPGNGASRRNELIPKPKECSIK